MTLEEKVDDVSQRITKVEVETNNNTKRLDEHDEVLKDNNNLIVSIKELAIETKYMRVDLNASLERITRLEARDCEADKKEGSKWEKFKWLLVAVLISLVAGYIFGSLGLVSP